MTIVSPNWDPPTLLSLPINTTLQPLNSSLSSSDFPPLNVSGFPAMLSAFPAMPSSDGLFGIHFFEGGFTPWDYQDPFLAFPLEEPTLLDNKRQEPILFNSGSDNSNPKPVASSPYSGQSEPNRKRTNSSSSSDDPEQETLVIDERKRRRMISNRESARRSRMRKQKHLENLRNQVNRLRVGKRELVNRLRIITQHLEVVRIDNDQLRSESAMLRQKLWAIHQILLVRELRNQLSPSAWPCNNNMSINQQINLV